VDEVVGGPPADFAQASFCLRSFGSAVENDLSASWGYLLPPPQAGEPHLHTAMSPAALRMMCVLLLILHTAAAPANRTAAPNRNVAVYIDRAPGAGAGGGGGRVMIREEGVPPV